MGLGWFGCVMSDRDTVGMGVRGCEDGVYMEQASKATHLKKDNQERRAEDVGCCKRSTTSILSIYTVPNMSIHMHHYSTISSWMNWAHCLSQTAIARRFSSSSKVEYLKL